MSATPMSITGVLFLIQGIPLRIMLLSLATERGIRIRNLVVVGRLLKKLKK